MSHAIPSGLLEAVWDLLDEFHCVAPPSLLECGWMDGGCLVLAEALADVLGGTVVLVRGTLHPDYPSILHHAGVQVGDVVIDASRVYPAGAFASLYGQDEQLTNTEATPMDLVPRRELEESGIPRHPEASQWVAARLREKGYGAVGARQDGLVAAIVDALGLLLDLWETGGDIGRPEGWMVRPTGPVGAGTCWHLLAEVWSAECVEGECALEEEQVPAALQGAEELASEWAADGWPYTGVWTYPDLFDTRGPWAVSWALDQVDPAQCDEWDEEDVLELDLEDSRQAATTGARGRSCTITTVYDRAPATEDLRFEGEQLLQQEGWGGRVYDVCHTGQTVVAASGVVVDGETVHISLAGDRIEDVMRLAERLVERFGDQVITARVAHADQASALELLDFEIVEEDSHALLLERAPAQHDLEDYFWEVLSTPTPIGPVTHVRVRRRDGAPIVGDWDLMQSIKDAALGRHVTAIEVYPAADSLVNEANIRHLWVLPPETIPPLLRRW